MFSLSTFCCVCLHDGEELKTLNENDYDNIELLAKLNFCALENEWIMNDVAIYICSQCCHILRLAYNFKKMCIKNNELIRGYVSKLKTSKDLRKNVSTTNVLLQNIKEFVDNIPLTKVKSFENPVKFKKENVLIVEENSVDTETAVSENSLDSSDDCPEVDKSFEPEIELQENDTPLKIEINDDDSNKLIKDKNKNDILYMNDFQEKSSTTTLERLKELVCGAKSQAIDQLKQLITEPIKYDMNPEFLSPHQESSNNDFETIYFKEEPLENVETVYEKSEETTSNHIKQIETLLNRKDNYCIICKKSFLCKSYYERHITMHTGIKNYECHLCKKRFTRKSTLKTHIYTHTGEVNHVCPVCGKRFTQKGNLKSHMATHNHDDRRFQCNICYKRFALKANLKVHLTTHVNINSKKPSCPICSKRFLKAILPTHISTHYPNINNILNNINNATI